MTLVEITQLDEKRAFEEMKRTAKLKCHQELQGTWPILTQYIYHFFHQPMLHVLKKAYWEFLAVKSISARQTTV